MTSNTTSSDPQLCGQCGGLCCQGHPGLWTDPQAFFARFFPIGPPTAAELPARLAPLQLTLRTLSGVAIPAPQTTEQGCIFLDANGCSLPDEQRPDQCRALVPSLDTLMAGEMHCYMPPEHGSGTARDNWATFWAQHKSC